MNSTRTVLILDDRQDTLRKWISDLQRIGLADVGYHIVNESEEFDFQNAVGQIEQRRKLVRSKELAGTDIEPARFDKVDVLIIDYDLLELDERSFITGEDVAYIARCFSGCGFIIALNQFGKNPFDLTLRGHLGSFADLNIGADQLANPNLWGLPNGRFRPWSWPVIPDLLNRLDQRVSDAQSHLDDPILPFLGFTDEDIGTLPREIVADLRLRPDDSQRSQIETHEITFRDLTCHSSLGLSGRDEPIDDGQSARIAAARLAKWLERSVLPGQEILVDGPHLVSRFRSLFRANDPTVIDLQRCTSREPEETGIDLEKLSGFHFEKSHWLNRPAWWWRRLQDCEAVDEVRDPWSVKMSDIVFCEDVSEFLPRAAARDFVADVPASAPQRWVVDTETAEGAVFADDLRGVMYVPPIQFTL